MFEILYWGSFIGRNDIVSSILNLGYSPLVQPHKKLENAVFGAVKGDQYDTLKLILRQRYISANLTTFESCREAYDQRGNTVMHIAYFYKRDKIAKLLEEHGYNDKLKLKRNNRGLLP